MAANPSYLQAGLVSKVVQQKEYLLDLYMYQRLEGSLDSNQKIIVAPKLPNYFGYAVAIDWTLYDDILPKGSLVARAQGLQLGAAMTEERWFASFNLVFTDARLKDSGLKLDGTMKGPDDNGEWAITGGTGVFAYAQGIATYKYIPTKPGETLRKLHIRVVCPSTTTPTTPIKVLPPVGGNGGLAVDVAAKPKSLQSVTIHSGDMIDSISFSYTDDAGNKQTAGPWGGNGGTAATVNLKNTEIVKKIMGTIGYFEGTVVVFSLKIVTNLDTYGPYGNDDIGTEFVIPEKDNNTVVGFHGRADKFLNAIGIYVIE